MTEYNASKFFAGHFREAHSGSSLVSDSGLDSSAACFARCAQTEDCVAFTYYPRIAKYLPRCPVFLLS